MTHVLLVLLVLKDRLIFLTNFNKTLDKLFFLLYYIYTNFIWSVFVVTYSVTFDSCGDVCCALHFDSSESYLRSYFASPSFITLLSEIPPLANPSLDDAPLLFLRILFSTSGVPDEVSLSFLNLFKMFAYSLSRSFDAVNSDGDFVYILYVGDYLCP